MSWTKWLREPIQTPYGSILRYKMISLFVEEGLYPFIQSCGYAWAGDKQWIKSAIATGLYENQTKHHLLSNWSSIDRLNTSYTSEDADHFHLIMTDKWNGFWESWGQWTDVDPESRFGDERRRDIEDFIWGQLNLNESSQTGVVNRFYEEEEQDEPDVRRHTDIYLRDATESNEWGGYRR